MATIDKEFALLCNTIMNEGKEYENKNRGVKRLQIPSYTFRHSFEDGFPAITNKKLYWKTITGELLWFLRGDNDVKSLNEIGIKIWNKDAYNWYVKHHKNNDAGTEGLKDNGDGSFRMYTFEEFEAIGEGSVGQNYSVQWRNFNGNTDQISILIHDMLKDIMSSRLKVNAWNPSETNETALPPCHSEFQIIGVPFSDIERCKIAGISPIEWEGICESGLEMESLELVPEFGFELHFNQRSVDTFLGLPFNIASYGLLAKILEMFTGFKALAIEGTLKCVHFYDNQYDVVKELLKRNPDTHSNCELMFKNRNKFSTLNFCLNQSVFAESYLPYSEIISDISSNLNSFLDLCSVDEFELVGYNCDSELKVEMLAPKEC